MNISKIQLSGQTYNLVDLQSGYATTEQVNAAVTGATAIINGELEKKFGYASYNESNKHIEFKANESGAVLAFIDATDFIKDGMVDNVEVKDGKLVITFNTDSGKEDIEIEISKIFNAENYYDKTAADAKFGTKTEQESLRSDLEDALGEIASLEADKQDKLTFYVKQIQGNETQNNIWYRYFASNSDGENYIQFKTINGGGIIGNGNIELPTKSDVNDAITAATAPINAALEGKQDKLEGKYVSSIDWNTETNRYSHNAVKFTFSEFSGGTSSLSATIKSATINGVNVINSGPIPEFELATKEELGTKADKSDTYTKGETDEAISKAIQGAGAITPEEVDSKIDTAINGLKTVGGESLKGGGNIALMTAKVEGDTLIFEFN